MKKFIISLLTASILLLPACTVKDFFSFDGLTGDSSSDDSSLLGDFDTADTSAIDSLNYYIDLLNSLNDATSYLESDLSYIEYDINNFADLGYDPSFTCYFELYDYDNLKAMTATPTGLTAEESAKLVPLAEKVFTGFDSTKKLCNDLSVYITAQDYETDDFAQGKTLLTNLYTSLDDLDLASDAISAYVDVLMEQYDTWEVDPNDPTSVGLGNMDTDTNTADEITELLEDAYTRDSFDRAAELQTLYDELNASVTANTGTGKPALDPSMVYYYETFYNDMNLSFLPVIKRSVRDFTNQDLEGMYTDYADAIDGYNLLIDDYNMYLDANSYSY